ncbi:MAG: N-acetylglucosamine-6-phosphate deacetylase [Clostridia bacterium]|nr:N-acetylglucosamine-6-phosphate deacetylase [Clostridia bacterium]
MKCIINGKIVLPDKVIENKALIFGETIENLCDVSEINLADYEVIDAAGRFVCPGLVDMHIHGYLGEDASDGIVDGVKKMAAGIVENGVTAWCPTTMTVSKDEILKAFDVARTVKNTTDYYGANVLGINCEGPFINPSKKGAQSEEHILRPDADFILDNADIIKVFTVAPEMDGGKECIEKVYKDGRVLVSMGHTGANFEEANTGIAAGVRHTTHLFNAMTPLQHRNPGVVGAALSAKNVSCELIADTFHVNKGLFDMVARLKGEKLCLITDCMRAGGMPDGDYTLGGQPVKKTGIQCLLEDGTIAGSVLKLNEAVRNLYENTDLSVAEAVACASLNPAKALSEDDKIGSIEIGKRANLMLCDEHFNVSCTVIGGTVRFEM